MSTPLLQVSELFAGYGKGDIVRGATLDVDKGEIVTVIGPNGAGKSSLIKAISGVLRPRQGTVTLADEVISGRRASDIARCGMAYVPQEANVFRTLTVFENLEMGAWVLPGRKQERMQEVFDLFPDLRTHARLRAGNLSGGQRQMVAMGMALMVNPTLLLMDEPSAGLSPRLVQEMFYVIEGLNSRGVAVLMVEQNAVQALRMSTRGYVLVAGEIRLGGSADSLLDNPEVRELYLGG